MLPLRESAVARCRSIQRKERNPMVLNMTVLKQAERSARIRVECKAFVKPIDKKY